VALPRVAPTVAAVAILVVLLVFGLPVVVQQASARQEEPGARRGRGGGLGRRRAAVHALRVGEDAAVEDGAAGPQDPVQRVRRALQVRAARARVPPCGQPHLRAHAALQLAPQGHGAAPPEGAHPHPRKPPRRRRGCRSRIRRAEAGAHVPRLRRVLVSCGTEEARSRRARALHAWSFFRSASCEILPRFFSSFLSLPIPAYSRHFRFFFLLIITLLVRPTSSLLLLSSNERAMNSVGTNCGRFVSNHAPKPVMYRVHECP
jgi:hypothetical protein